MFYPKEESGNRKGCDTIDNKQFLTREGDPFSFIPPFVLLDRGSCTFVQKARNAEYFGAALAIIADNVDLETPNMVVMEDDGSGHSLTIPSVLLSKADA